MFSGNVHSDNRSGADGPWHDTHGNHNHDIRIWKDENLLLDYSTFWAPQNKALLDYIAMPASDDSIRNFELCLASCKNRIINTRQPEEAEAILQNLKVTIFQFMIIIIILLCILFTLHHIDRKVLTLLNNTSESLGIFHSAVHYQQGQARALL